MGELLNFCNQSPGILACLIHNSPKVKLALNGQLSRAGLDDQTLSNTDTAIQECRKQKLRIMQENCIMGVKKTLQNCRLKPDSSQCWKKEMQQLNTGLARDEKRLIFKKNQLAEFKALTKRMVEKCRKLKIVRMRNSCVNNLERVVGKCKANLQLACLHLMDKTYDKLVSYDFIFAQKVTVCQTIETESIQKKCLAKLGNVNLCVKIIDLDARRECINKKIKTLKNDIQLAETREEEQLTYQKYFKEANAICQNVRDKKVRNACDTSWSKAQKTCRDLSTVKQQASCIKLKMADLKLRLKKLEKEIEDKMKADGIKQLCPKAMSFTETKTCKKDFEVIWHTCNTTGDLSRREECLKWRIMRKQAEIKKIAKEKGRI